MKWLGIALLACFVGLVLLVIKRLHASRRNLLRKLYLPLIAGNFIALVVPWIFMNAWMTRVCFVVAQLIYLGGIVVAVRGLVQANQEPLLRADS